MPKYETEESLAREAELVRRFCELHDGFGFQKLSATNYRVDFAIYDSKDSDRLLSFAEAKDRSGFLRNTRGIHFGDYDGCFVASVKVAHGRMLGRSSGVPFIFIGNFIGDVLAVADCSDYVDIGPCRRDGRTDRGNASDMEPVHVVAWHLFEKL